jgi:hypothetical protein
MRTTKISGGKTRSGNQKAKRPFLWLAWLGLLILLAFVGLLLDFFLYPRFAMPSGPSRNIAENGLWLRYTWYFGRYTPQTEQAMLQRLQTAGVRYAYFHVLSVDGTGVLKYHKKDSALKLTSYLHKASPQTKLYAWVYAGNRQGLGQVDLSNPQTLHHMVKEAVWLTKTCGFDGVQWDYECCNSDDVGFVQLLRATRAAIGPKKLIGVASPVRMPDAVAGRLGWSDAYFEKISRLCNQICVMGYDTGMVTPRTYVAFMRMQTICVTADVSRANPRCRVLIGIPTYDDKTPSHNPYSENLRFALTGVRNGAANKAARPGVLAGVAVFADYTTDYGKWLQYQALWPLKE